MKCKLRRVHRLDSIKPDKTYFTEEGYLVDHPILTSTGIFEYTNPDGSIRRELRLPEHVFAEKSLASYKGKPIIITHDAGLVDKSNVEDEQIGTILSEGYRDGEDVRAEIVIHNTDRMKECGLKELSLGYSLDDIEEPGEWNGEPYDAIQTNIVINHLALVANARAGDQARLNIDGADEGPILRGGKAKMKKNATTKRGTARYDEAILTPEQLAEAISKYCQENGIEASATDEEEENAAMDADETVAQVQENQDRRDAEGEPEDVEGAREVIAQQDADINTLLALVKQLQEQSGAAPTNADDEESENGNGEDSAEENSDEDESVSQGEEEENTDGDGAEDKSLNADSADQIVRQRLAICRVGDKLNMDGLERLSIMNAKRAIIKKVLPSMRLDGKGEAYINAAYDIAVERANSRKGTVYQKAQMCNGAEKRLDSKNTGGSAAEARKAMIQRREGGKQ